MSNIEVNKTPAAQKPAKPPEVKTAPEIPKTAKVPETVKPSGQTAAPKAAEAVPTKPAAEEKKPIQQSTMKKPTGKPGGFCVYLGPSIRGVITSGAVFPGKKDQVLASLSSAIEKYPLIAQLIVTEKTIAEDRAKVKKPGSLLHINYRRLASGKK